MDTWGVLVGLGLLAASIAVIAFVRYRERETATLRRDADLVRELRELASGDEVRIAAVDEFELTIYQRLFYASVVGPRIRSAAWALLATALAVTAVLVVHAGHGLLFTTVTVGAMVLAVVFGIATITFASFALYHAATTPRVSFAESYAAASPSAESSLEESSATEPSATEPSATEPTVAKSSEAESTEAGREPTEDAENQTADN